MRERRFSPEELRTRQKYYASRLFIDRDGTMRVHESDNEMSRICAQAAEDAEELEKRWMRRPVVVLTPKGGE